MGVKKHPMYELANSPLDRARNLSLFGLFSACRSFLYTTLYPDFLGSTAKALQANGGKVGKTAYLDGLRGFAALMIYSQHNTDYAHQQYRENINHAWGWNGEYYFTRTPVIAIFFHTGNLAVMFFFAISGYVTAISLLKLLHAQDTNKMAHRMGVAIPQRFIRLWGPACCVTFTYMVSSHLLGVIPDGPHYPLAPTLSEDIPRWIGNFFTKSYLFSPTASQPNDLYDPHLWYIPLQFQASILVYVVLLSMLSFARYPASVRIWSMIALTLYFTFFVNAYFCALSIFGLVICDIDLLADKDALPAPFSRKMPKWFWYILLIMGLYLCTAPAERSAAMIRTDPGWYYLSYLKPPSASNAAHWFNAWAGALILLAIPRIPWLKKFFELPFLRDLGKITFSFYLIQGPVLWTLGSRIYAIFGILRPQAGATVPGWTNLFPLPNWGPMGIEVNYIAANAILLPTMIIIGSVCTKIFEAPCNTLAVWAFNPDRYKAQPPPPQREGQLPMVETRQHPMPGAAMV